VVCSYRWRDAQNPYGVPGLMYGEARRPGGGTHGTLSKYCIHNTLVAAGPDIVAGQRSALPSGNIDVVPTLLHLLGLPHPAGTDGRVLVEALIGAKASGEKPVTQRREATRALPGGKTWRQYLQTTTYAGKTYFDEGNAAAE
jgi:arylsulfatase A-like enzyme